MTVTLGWKSALAAALLVVVAGLGIWLAVRNAKQRSVTDWERLQQIEQLGERLGMALKEIERLRKESDGYRDQRDKSAEATAAALAKYKALKSIQDKTPEQEVETCQACELALGLLETDLALADLEALSLRRERAALIAALADSEEMYSLQTKRLAASQRDKKKVKRRNIWTNVSIAAASITLGFGMGRL